jgi:DNA-binding NarL/FixJ family response regulator
LISRHNLLTEALHALFKRERDVRVIGEGADEAGALQLATSTTPDVALVDMITQVVNVFAIVRQLKKHSSKLRIVALSMCSDEAYVSQVLRNGAPGFVLSTHTFSSLAHAVRGTYERANSRTTRYQSANGGNAPREHL